MSKAAKDIQSVRYAAAPTDSPTPQTPSHAASPRMSHTRQASQTRNPDSGSAAAAYYPPSNPNKTETSNPPHGSQRRPSLPPSTSSSHTAPKRTLSAKAAGTAAAPPADSSTQSLP